MATVLESLKGINAYPIPLRTLVDAAEYRGLDMTVEVSQEIMQTAKYKLAQADLLLWLSLAPDVTQGGQSYSFTDEQRIQFRNRANRLYGECQEESNETEIHLRVQRFKTMIIANGTIETKIKTGGGIDPDTDYPIAPSVSWGNPIECQYRANKYSNKGKANGEAFTIASYEILIDEQPYNAEMLRLRDISGKILGEFSVIEVEPLQGVCQIRILV